MSAGASRLLVVGASGLVGAELVRRASGSRPVLGVAREVQGAATERMDLADPAQIERTVARFAPDVVAICSAWPNVDGCESDPARSHRENVTTVANLLAATRGAGPRFLFFSTDHVFDGTREANVESDPVRPLSVYARHKREVEELLLARGRSLIARTAWVFGAELRRKNFVYRVISAARSGELLKLPVKQAGCPTWSGWLVESALALLDQGTEGVVHLGGDELFTKADWAREIARELELAPCRVAEVAWPEAGQVAPRPERVRLRSERHTLTQPPVASILRRERAALIG